jgi:hypothetical protein
LKLVLVAALSGRKPSHSRPEAVAQRCLRRQPPLAQAEVSGVECRLEAPRANRRAEGGDHATRGIAVEHRERPAQDLDALGTGEVEVADLALAIGHRGRDAVAVQAHAAHTEAGARAEAAR